MAKIETNPMWKYLGGCLCLDFLNTVGGRAAGGNVLREKLVDYSALVEWSRGAGAINSKQAQLLDSRAAARPGDARAMLARAVALRESLYRIFRAVLHGRRPQESDLDGLTREVRIAQARHRLSWSRAGFEWRWQEPEDALDPLLWPVALSAADVLTSGDLSRIRQCAGNECGWLFLDTSRNGSRRWCDMQECGNRAKVRRFRERLSHARRVGKV